MWETERTLFKLNFYGMKYFLYLSYERKNKIN